MSKKAFDNIMLTGRGGSGKTEFIEFMRQVPEAERKTLYHIGAFEEMDDFPWLYSMFQDEDLWEMLGRPRKLAKKRESVYVTLDYEIYNFLTLKFNLEIKKKLSGQPNFYDEKTLFIEYARGRDNAYKTAFGLFDEDILRRTAIFFLDNTFEESMRRNMIRSTDSDSKQSVLKHKVPVEVMEYLYKTNDWHDLTENRPHGYINLKNFSVPFVTVWNIPESHDFSVLEKRYAPALKKLWELYSNRLA